MNENISIKADELRKRLKNARTETTGTENDTNAGTINTDELKSSDIGVSTSSAIIQRYTPIGGPEDRGTEFPENTTVGRGNQQAEPNERFIPGQDNRNHSARGTVAEFKGRISSSIGSASQDDKRERSQFGRSGENNSAYRPNGNDVSTSSTGSQRPKRIGNLVRNVIEEPNFIPTRTFNIPSTEENPNANIVFKSRDKERPDTYTNATSPTTEQSVKGIEKPRKRGRPRIERDEPEQATNVNVKEDEKNLKEKVTDFLPHYTGNKLTAHEATTLQEPLSAALEDIFEQCDKFLFSYCGLPSVSDGTQPVWSDISDKEMKAFVKSWMALGQKSSMAAGVARGAVGLSDFIIGAAVLGPRIKKSGELIRQTRGNNKKGNKRANSFSGQNV